eukprot:scaffold935_cov155-Amphora_coffeaeformis.AAC.11
MTKYQESFIADQERNNKREKDLCVWIMGRKVRRMDTSFIPLWVARDPRSLSSCWLHHWVEDSKNP